MSSSTPLRLHNGHLWSWPERLRPSEWVERAPIYVPDNSLNAEPGPYSLDRTPWWREVLDTAMSNEVRELWIYKGNQLGFTRLLINLIGYWIDQDPGAVGLLMPDEDSINELFAEELIPTIKATPALKRHMTRRAWDSTTHDIWLDSMPVFGLYAGSATRLEKRPLRYVLGDEINLYRTFSATASPIQLLLKRTTTWGHRAKAVFGSKPTTPEGNISIGYEGCPDKREYWWPCPRCSRYQLPKWGQVKGFMSAPGANKAERANWVRINQPCYYECEFCRGQMQERERWASVMAGKWVSQNQSVDDGGNLVGERAPSMKVGFHVWSIVSAWLSFSDLCAEFIEAEGDIDKTRDFHNARRALPWHHVDRSVRPSVVRDKRAISPPPFVVPKWAVGVYTTVDTQTDWFAYCIRAWGNGLRSQLIAYGIIQGKDFGEVYRIGLESRIPIDGGGVTSPMALLIDSGGDRTTDVYDFARTDPRIFATKGMSRHGIKLWYDTEPRSGVRLRMTDTDHYKGMLWNLLHDPDDTKWLPHSDVPEQYCMEMASEHLIRDKSKKLVWQRTGLARNEAWDCEVLQCAAADMDNVGIKQPGQPTTAAQAPSPEASRNPLSYQGRW